jgi:hypothetical protein
MADGKDGRQLLPNLAELEPNRNAIQRRGAEIAELSAEKTKNTPKNTGQDSRLSGVVCE